MGPQESGIVKSRDGPIFGRDVVLLRGAMQMQEAQIEQRLALEKQARRNMFSNIKRECSSYEAAWNCQWPSVLVMDFIQH